MTTCSLLWGPDKWRKESELQRCGYWERFYLGDTWLPPRVCPPPSTTLGTSRPLCPWDSPGKNTGVGSHSLLQGVFPTQGWKPGLLRGRWVFYRLSCQGRPTSLGAITILAGDHPPHMQGLLCARLPVQDHRL